MRVKYDDERYDIEIQDKISSTISSKLKGIASDARAGATAIERLSASLNTLNTGALDLLSNAAQRAASAQAKLDTAAARLATAQAKVSAVMNSSALAQAKLATETARTTAAQNNANAAASRAAAAASNQIAAADRLAAAQARSAAAANASVAAQRLNNAAQQAGSGVTRQYRQQLTNLTYQLNDVVVGLASGQKPLTVLLQQGSQISTIFGTGNGVLGTFKQLGKALTALIPPQVLIGVATIAAGILTLTHNIREATGVQVTLGETVKGVFQTLGSTISGAANSLFNVKDVFKDIGDFISESLKIVFIWATTVPVLIINAIDDIKKHLNEIDLSDTKVGRFFKEQKEREDRFFGRAADAPAPAAPTVKGTIDSLVSQEGLDRADRVFKQISDHAKKNFQDDQKDKPHKLVFQDILDKSNNDVKELQATGQARLVLTAILDAEEKLHRKLTDTEKNELTQSVLAKEVAKARSDILSQFNDALEQQNNTVAAATQLLKEHLITQEQFNKVVGDARLKVLALSTDLNGGLEAGLIRIGQEFGNVAELASNTLVNAFQSAEDALVSFVQTGKVDFKSLVDSILSDLIRLEIRQSITGPIAGALGLAGTAADAGGTASAGSGFGAFVLRNLPSFDVGTDYVQHDMVAKIHQGEGILTKSENAARLRGANDNSMSMNSTTVFAPSINVEYNSSGGSDEASGKGGEKIAQLVTDAVNKQMMDFTRRETRQGGMFNRQNKVQ